MKRLATFLLLLLCFASLAIATQNHRVYLPVVLRASRLAPPATLTPTATTTPGLTVRGHVRLESSSGPGLGNVAIHLFFANYGPGDVVATTDADGYYETPFFYIPGDEMVTVWAELAGYSFDPEHHYWRHYGGVEDAVRDFVAHAVSPTHTATTTLTPTPSPSPTATGTPTSTSTPTPTPTATPTQTTVPGPADVQVAGWCSQFDAPGNDNENLNEEYVCFQNQGGSAVDMSGWHVRDVADHTYTFPSFTLPAGAHVRLHTGPGTDTANDLYWGQRRAVWNNVGDTVYLYDTTWQLVDEYSYS